MKLTSPWNRIVDLTQPVVMGILNLTPDSFFDGGKYLHPDSQLRRVEEMLNQGAAIIDLGSVSSRPGSREICSATESDRLLPSLKMIRHHFPESFISVDTFRPEIARLAIDAGADMINDIYAGSFRAGMIELMGETGAPYVMMHMQGTPDTMQKNPSYSNVVDEVIAFFTEKLSLCSSMNVSQAIIDPGFGFGKSLDHNYILLKHLDRFATMGSPVMVGLSRKSMICKALGINPEDALNGTTVLNTVALHRGARILRVHDVWEACQTIKLLSMIT